MTPLLAVPDVPPDVPVPDVPLLLELLLVPVEPLLPAGKLMSYCMFSARTTDCIVSSPKMRPT